jgi:hypothetical protein
LHLLKVRVKAKGDFRLARLRTCSFEPSIDLKGKDVALTDFTHIETSERYPEPEEYCLIAKMSQGPKCLSLAKQRQASLEA